jgi:hypothetical protein
MIGSVVARERPTLGRSRRPASGSLYSGRTSGPRMSRATITGRAMRNTEPHQKLSRSKPPMTGPMAPPAENAEIHTAMARERWPGSWNMLKMRDRVDGAMVAPAMPSRARLRMSISALVENAARSEVAPNAAAPMSSSLRRPMRSPSVPIVTRKPATMNP